MDKLAVCACYFNPLSWDRRLQNARTFIESAKRQGADLWIIEGYTPGSPPDIEPQDGIHKIDVPMVDMLWQKERLLNILISQLPAEYDAIAWVDADIIWSQDSWVAATKEALQHSPVVQLFSEAHWLDSINKPMLWREAYPPTYVINSIPRQHELQPDKQLDFALGHPGFAWAIQRDVLSEIGGLYDHHITGSGDSVMVCSFYGWFEHPYYTTSSQSFLFSCNDWCNRAYSVIKGRVGYVPGLLQHLWHGDWHNRRYWERLISLSTLGFDAARDIEKNKDGLWQWTEHANESIRNKLQGYFYARREDDTST